MAIIFDGKAFAASKQEKLKRKVANLKKRGIVPKLVTIVVGDDSASHLYVKLKKEAGSQIGALVEIKKFDQDIKPSLLIQFIKRLNNRKKVHGTMVQMPLPERIKDLKSKIIDSILPQKDVDGLRKESPFIHPTAQAVIKIINYAKTFRSLAITHKPLVVVVGSTGMVGSSVSRLLEEEGSRVIGCNSENPLYKCDTKSADILISAVGKPNLIKADRVKKGAIVIDVGSPKGDVDLSVRTVAGFVAPVPGGVGPVTISCLLENLVKAAYNTTNTH